MDSTNIKISICSIAYRDKRIIETLENAIKTADVPSNISIFILVQDSYHHEIEFESSIGTKSIQYFPWHNFNGFAYNRKRIIDVIPSDHYILFINPGTEFTQSWDSKLNDFAKSTQSILSIKNDIFDLSGSFIKKDFLTSIQYPRYLKHLGEEADISIKLYAAGVPVVGGISEIIKPSKLRDWDYIPFSISHKYNEVKKLYDLGINSYSKINDRYKEYAEKYPIKEIFDQLDDPLYTASSLNTRKTPYEVFNDTKNKV